MTRRAPPSPACVMIGPAGAGKSAALAASGATMIADTPGRLMAPGPQRAVDREEWQALVAGLSKVQPQPHGVVVVLGIDMLLRPAGDGQTLAPQLVAIRQRLDDLGRAFGADLPVWILFTKADLVPGFTAFMGGLGEAARRGIWGTADASTHGFEALAKRLSAELTDRLQEEPDPSARIAIFGFPQHFAALREPVAEVVRHLFGTAAGKNGTNPRPRGIYFGSTLEGGFFLRDLLTGLIPARENLAAGQGRHVELLGRVARAAMVVAALGLTGAFAASYVSNSALVADVDRAIDEASFGAAILAEQRVGDTRIEQVAGVLTALRALPTGYGDPDTAPSFIEGFGLSQREKLSAAAGAAYDRALERLLRSRLTLAVEQAVQENVADPVRLYEPLKTYLMLGHEAPSVDEELIVAWFVRDWEENHFPGPHNSDGRRELEAHLRAMLAFSRSRGPAYELDRPIVEAAQRSLSRIDLAEFAWALVQSGSYGARLSDFAIAERGGPQAAMVFEDREGADLADLSVPGAFTWSGFNSFLLPALATVAQRVTADQWIMGAGGQQVGVEDQLHRLGPALLDRYGREFLAAWNSLFDRLKLRALTEDRPDYAALRAAAGPTSPLRMLIEAIAAETALSRGPREGEARALSGLDEAAMMQGLSRIGIDYGGAKSQNRAGAAFASSSAQQPGANIEAQFRPFQALVEGIPRQRPIDALIQNLGDVHQSLLFAANTPSQAERAKANLQLQVHNLRANASRLPRQLAVMINQAANEFESDVAQSSVAQLSRLLETSVTRPCNAIVADAYPFARGSQRDVPMADFVRLFAPGGEFERFFVQNLAPLADISGQRWRWKEDSRMGRELSEDTLRSFEQAARIREAFFPPGAGANPTMEITFTPFSLHSDADLALLDVNGQIVQTRRTGNTPSTITWPDSRAIGGVALSLTPEMPGRIASMRFDGPWALMRLFDAGTIGREGDLMRVQFVIGGRDVAYTVRPGGSDAEVFTSFADFRCPEGL